MTDVDSRSAEVSCDNPKLARIEAGGRQVRDAMVARPKTLPVEVTVGAVRDLFGNPHVLSALLVDGARFAGVIERDALPPDADTSTPARQFATTRVPTISADAPLAEAVEMLDTDGSKRLVVLAEDGGLAGLLCLDSQRTRFCQS
jgi:CBS domain-containing protein